MDNNVKNLLALQQLENVSKLLGGELKHHYCSDLKSTHERYTIEFNHQKKEND